MIFSILKTKTLPITIVTRIRIGKILAKYDKRGKYLPILHEATCNINTLSLNACWSQIQQELSYLSYLTTNFLVNVI